MKRYYLKNRTYSISAHKQTGQVVNLSFVPFHGKCGDGVFSI